MTKKPLTKSLINNNVGLYILSDSLSSGVCLLLKHAYLFACKHENKLPEQLMRRWREGLCGRIEFIDRMDRTDMICSVYNTYSPQKIVRPLSFVRLFGSQIEWAQTEGCVREPTGVRCCSSTWVEFTDTVCCRIVPSILLNSAVMNCIDERGFIALIN